MLVSDPNELGMVPVSLLLCMQEQVEGSAVQSSERERLELKCQAFHGTTILHDTSIASIRGVIPCWLIITE
jgi:hypothetical protein